MNNEQHNHASSGLKIFLVLFFLFSLNPGSFSNGTQIQDTLQRIARFDHTVNDSDYYYVRLFLFHSDFERLRFYNKAYDRGIYIADKHNFHDDSTLFRTTFNKEQALLEFQDLYQNAEKDELTTSETVKKEIVHSSPFYYSLWFRQGDSLDAPSGSAIVCSQAEVACSENTYKFSSGTTGTAEPPVGGYPDYGCLSSQPCPAWFYMQVSVAGNIVIFISQVGLPPPFPPPPLDVDFICWGPFTSLTDGCATGLTGPNIVDCSYSPNATETCTITNAQVGEMYILLITNYSTQPGTITFSQTGGSGVTNCNIVNNCSMVAITATPTVCDELTNTFSVSGNIEFTNPSPTGTLTITDSTAVPHISQSFTPPFTSPLPYTLSNIPCDGATHYLTAIFSDSLTCNLTQQVISPPTVCPHALISGGGDICDDGISETNVNIDISGSPGPYSFTYAINGTSQTPVINYSGPMPYPIITKIPGLYTLVSVSNQVCPVGGIVTGSANVILNPLPVPSFISGENSVCLNIPGEIYMTEAGKSNYIWTIPPQATITAGGTANDNSVTLTWNTTGSYVISVNYSDPVTHCTASSATPFSVTVKPLPVPSFIAGENPVCLNIPGKIYTTEAGKLNYIWTIPPQATKTAGGTGTDNSITLTWNTVGSYSISVNYTDPVTLCTATSATPFPVTILPTPDLANTIRTDSICDSTFATMALSSNVTGTTFTWRAFASSPDLTGFSNQLTGTNLISQRIDNTGYSIQTVTYRLLPLANGCAGDSIDVVFSVFPTPDLSNTPLTKTICDSTLTNVVLTSHVAGTTFIWTCTPSSANITGWSNNIVATSTLNQQLDNTGNNIESVNYHMVPKINGCNGHNTNFIVTVNPSPHLTNPNPAPICSGDPFNLTLISDVAGTDFTWTAFCNPIGSVTGFTNLQVTNVVAIADVLTNITNNFATVTYQITPHANSCNGPIRNFTIQVNPTPVVLFDPSTPSICSSQKTNIGLGSLVSGSTFSWTATASSPTVTGYSDGNGFLISQTLTTPGIQEESVTYHITPTANGCDGATVDYTVIINPKPHLTNQPMTQTICSEKTTNINLTASCLNPTYTWTATLVSGNVTGFSNGSGPVIAQTLTNLLPTTGQVRYTISPMAVPCIGNDTNYIVDVKPMPHLTNILQSKAICNNNNTNITLEYDVTGTLFTWTCTPSSVNLSGFNNNNTPSGLLDQILTNSGFTTETVTYHITPHANGCDGPVTDFIVTVYPIPNLANIDRTDSICDSTFTAVNLTSSVAGTLFTWRAFGSSPLVTGYANSTIPGTTINQRLENKGFVLQTVTYRLIPKANGCSGDSIDFVVTVFPTPDLSNPSLIKEICNNNNTSIPLNSAVTGALFTWTCTPGSINITGYSNSIAPGTQINQNLINTGDTPETVTYNITPHANGCNGWVYHYVVTVIPSPYLTNSPLRNTQCNNQNTNLTLTSNVAGTQFNWTASASSPALTGYSNSVAPGTLITQTLGNTGFNVDSVTYHVTPVTSGCPGSVTDYNVVVFPTPDVFFVPNGETVCEGVASGISNHSHVNGTTWSWTSTASSPNLSGYSDSNGNMIVQTISNSGSTVESVTYHVTPVANGCPPGISQNVMLTVKPRPVIANATTTFQLCNNTSTAIFLQTDVPGSTFAWRAFGSSPAVTGFSGGSGSSITQVLTNTGFNIETVTYRVAATATGCTGDSTDFIMTVFPVADAYFIPPSQAICPLQTCNITNNSHVQGASFIWTATGSSGQVSGYSGGSGILIQQTLNNTGYNIETVTYLVSPSANGCAGTNNNVVVTVDPAPIVSLTLCVDPVTTTDAQAIKLKGGNPANGTYSGRGVSSGTLFPALAGVGADTIFYSFTNTYGCSRNNYLVLSIISPLPFSCGNTLTDPRDNRQYPTIQIVNQCWMAANLDYGQQVSSLLTQRDNCMVEKYCYDDIPGSCTSNGGLYQWDELMKYDNTLASQGYCPPGWHIPTETDWNTLFGFYISNGFAGSSLKYDGYSGFNAFLYGASFKNASSDFNGFATLFWSSTSFGPYKAWAHGMNSDNPSVSYYPSARSNAFSIRCLKD